MRAPGWKNQAGRDVCLAFLPIGNDLRALSDFCEVNGSRLRLLGAENLDSSLRVDHDILPASRVPPADDTEFGFNHLGEVGWRWLGSIRQNQQQIAGIKQSDLVDQIHDRSAPADLEAHWLFQGCDHGEVIMTPLARIQLGHFSFPLVGISRKRTRCGRIRVVALNARAPSPRSQ